MDIRASKSESEKAARRIGIVMFGVTGRMGTNQHLERSIAEIRGEGGLRLDDGGRLFPDPILVGRNEEKLRELAAKYGVERWSTDLDSTLSDPRYEIFFDASATNVRVGAVKRAIAAGKHIYCEKPTATNLADALELYRLARAKGVKHGVVQDKLWLPGLRKLKRLIDSGFFGRILAVKGEFGYWVFEGDWQPAQRPSWNYRKDDGGSYILDMFAHWRYVLEGLFGAVKAVSCRGATHIPNRVDEHGTTYAATADDAAYATFELDRNIIAHVNGSWGTRVRRGWARRSRACGAVTSSRARRRRSRCGIPTSRRPSTSSPAGRRSRTTIPMRTPSGRNGSCSCGTSRRTSRFRGICSPAPRACSSPSSGSGAGPSGAGSISPS